MLVYNPKKQRGKYAKWVICCRGPAIVQCKLKESNYVLRKGKCKCVVVHVDRMRKLPISSLDGESSVESSDSHTQTRENNESTIPSCKRRRTQPATGMSKIHPMETANCGNRAASISPVDKATDNHSHTKPARYLECVAASSSLIDRIESRLCVVPGKACCLACTCVEKPFTVTEALSSDVLSRDCCCCSAVVKRMPKRHRISDPDAEGWHTVGSGGGNTSPEWSASPSVSPMAAEDRSGRSASPSVSPMVAEDCPGAANGSKATAEGDGAPAVPAASPPRRQIAHRQPPQREFVSRACIECDWSKLFTSRNSLNKHLKLSHGTFFSAEHRCDVPLWGAEAQVRQQRGHSLS